MERAGPHRWLTARHHLQFVDSRQVGYPVRLAGAVYDWAEVETGFQGDTAALLLRADRKSHDPVPAATTTTTST